MHKKSIYLSKIFIIFILLFGLTVDISISEATSKNNKDSMIICKAKYSSIYSRISRSNGTKFNFIF